MLSTTCVLSSRSFKLHLCAVLCLSLCACLQQQIMKDRWMNVGYEEEELMPYIEPQPDYKDPKRTGQHPGSAGGWKRGGADVWCWWAGSIVGGGEERVDGMEP